MLMHTRYNLDATKKQFRCNLDAIYQQIKVNSAYQKLNQQINIQINRIQIDRLTDHKLDQQIKNYTNRSRAGLIDYKLDKQITRQKNINRKKDQKLY